MLGIELHVHLPLLSLQLFRSDCDQKNVFRLVSDCGGTMVFACFLDVSNGVSNGQKIIDKKLVKNCSRMIHHFFYCF